jgi:putative ABC transport system permease protein
MPFSVFRHALRRLWRDRSVTLVALVVLALGIGANTALFTVVDAVLLKPLPYPAPDRLVALRLTDATFQTSYSTFPVNAAHVRTWADRCGSCEAVAAIDSMTTTLTGSGESELLDGARVTASFFSVLGITPSPGRAFSQSEDRPGGNSVAVISRPLWIRKFGADPSVVGRVVTLDGAPVTIVGVLPARAPIPGPQQLGDLVRLPRAIDVLRPAGFTNDELQSAGDLDYGVIARIRAGTSSDALRAELAASEPEIAKATGDPGHKQAVVEPLQAMIVRNARGPLVLLLAATAAILLIVCVNLANLLLARHAGRARDAAIRSALGAGRSRLIVESLTESVLLAIGGGLVGTVLAIVLARIIEAAAPPALPLLNTLSFDARVLAVLFGSMLAAGMLVGTLPAVRQASVQPGETLKVDSYTSTEGPGGSRTRRLLVAAQAAIGVTLLVATGLLVVSFIRLLHVDKGFDPEGVLTVDVALPPSSYPTAEPQLRFFEDVLTRVRVLPGVTMAATTNRLPLRGEATVNHLSYQHDTRPLEQRPLANYRYVSPDYFAAIGTPILRGRTFRDTDRGRQVVVLSARAAEALWPGQDPIGRIVRTGGYLGADSVVIGVAADTRAVDLTRNDILFTYLPVWLRVSSVETLVVRARVPSSTLTSAVRRAILDAEPAAAIPRVQTMDDAVGAAIADRRFELSLMTAFGVAAAVLAALGVFGVVSYSVARRGREMGIRISLGATTMDIHRLVFEEGMTPVAIGIVAGLTASLAVGRAMASLLFDVRPSDPLVMAAAALTIVIATVVACAAPARRASRAILLH